LDVERSNICVFFAFYDFELLCLLLRSDFLAYCFVSIDVVTNCQSIKCFRKIIVFDEEDAVAIKQTLSERLMTIWYLFDEERLPVFGVEMVPFA
jgi:hypothetical protein